jgi:hypothetical protein
MPVRGVHHDHDHAGFHQRFDALLRAFADTDRRARAQLALLVLGRVRVLARRGCP